MRFDLIVQVSPSRLAAFLLENPKLARKILSSIRDGYELVNRIEIRFQDELMTGITGWSGKHIAAIAEPPITHIDLKAAMLQARLVWLPRMAGIESKRALEILRTESPHITFASIMGIEKSKAASIRLLTDYEMQGRLDYIDAGIGKTTLGWLKSKHRIENSRDLAKVLNHYVMSATLHIAYRQQANIFHFGLDDAILQTGAGKIQIQEPFFVRMNEIEKEKT